MSQAVKDGNVALAVTLLVAYLRRDDPDRAVSLYEEKILHRVEWREVADPRDKAWECVRTDSRTVRGSSLRIRDTQAVSVKGNLMNREAWAVIYGTYAGLTTGLALDRLFPPPTIYSIVLFCCATIVALVIGATRRGAENSQERP